MTDPTLHSLDAHTPFADRHIGLRPDAPSDEGVISRVVGDFAIHRRR